MDNQKKNRGDSVGGVSAGGTAVESARRRIRIRRVARVAMSLGFSIYSLMFPWPQLKGEAAADGRSPDAGSAAGDRSRPYRLGAGDQFTVSVPNLETEFTGKTFRIDPGGDVTLPFAGRVQAAGLATPQLEAEIRSRLGGILKQPEVVVSLSFLGSQPVSILGSVNNPGIRQIEGRKSLFEVLSLAGGLRPDAGYLIRIRRDMEWGAIPLPAAKADATGRYSVASVSVKNIMNAADTGENIAVMPGDSISVPKADVVYAVGNVTKPGGFPLNEHETLSALQVVSLAEGLQRTAAADRARILRIADGSPDRKEIPVNLKALMSGKGTDLPLQAGDILFVPNSAAKSATFRTVDAIVNAATGLALVAH